jgi:LytR cell envelope-related transcriptional attenuator
MTQPEHRGGSGGTQTGKALLVIVVVVVVGWLVLRHGSSSPSAASATTRASVPATTTPASTIATTTTTVALIAPSSIKLQVLNGVGSGMLATEWSNKLKANPGYNTLAPNNATATVPTSTIYVMSAAYIPDADHLAALVGLSSAAVNPTVPAPASAPIPTGARAAANLVLVIGPNLAGSA